jgi:hypothetical protein
METATIEYEDMPQTESGTTQAVNIYASVNAYFTYNSEDRWITYDASGKFVEGPAKFNKEEFSNLLSIALKTKQQYLEAFVNYLQLLRNKIKDGDLFPLEELKNLPDLSFSDFRREIEILGDSMLACLYYERNNDSDSGWLADEALVALTDAYAPQFKEQLRTIKSLTAWEALKYQQRNEI